MSNHPVPGPRDNAFRAFRLLALLAACAFPLAFLGASGCRADPVRLGAGEFRRGVSLGLYASDPYYDYGPLIGEVAGLEANAISFVVALMQEDAESVQVRAVEGRTATDKALRLSIRRAHKLGLEVMVLPIVLLKDDWDGAEWRGTIRPKDLDAWFASYGERLLHLARLAEEEGAAWLSVGSEFCSLEERSERWEALIAQVRAAYSGRLVYSANWDHLDTLKVWPKLDAMGMSGYFELAETTEPEPAELERSWDYWRQEIHRQRAALGVDEVPLMFTEIGYPSQDGAARYPWDYTLGKPLDLEEQRLCFEAFFAAWKGDPSLRGAYVYNWFGKGGPEDGDYTPRGKPAADLIRQEYANWPGRSE
jgi:hypothetical protein